MDNIKNYLTSDKGEAFKTSFWFCCIGTATLTFVMGAMAQAKTAVLVDVPGFGYFFGLSNRMVPFGLAVCLMVMALGKGKELWQKRDFVREIILGAFVFSLSGFALGLGGI